ncbi:MAG: hypothetical protein C0601_07710 [Candidatus Muiribacterium halophilum]|uniref:CopG family transcriptional regulator n=1 Tax=Muiribacterium halophilum TaxID=2053465 RepID=A0A2N5ZFM3_MUIH1|nr:MAG: hypothetical protein C0601_07710 [Candidatus Muirbacterium halophilum]
MKKTLLLILVDGRKKSAVNVQKILTEWGCLVKTRLGIHDGVLENCSESGLLILEMVGDSDKHEELARKISVLPGVSTKLVNLEV